MKLYRCFIGVLLVFFITLAVLYVATFYDEQRSIDEGILVQCDIKGGECIVTDHRLC